MDDKPYKIAILWRGDREARQAATPQRSGEQRPTGRARQIWGPRQTAPARGLDYQGMTMCLPPAVRPDNLAV